MKKLKYIILLAGLVACSDLEEVVYSEISPSNYYQNEEEAQVAVTSIYNSFNRFISLYDFGLSSLAVVPSPKIQSKVSWRRKWANYTTDATDAISLPRVWNPFYRGIFRSNVVISELEGREFISEEETARKEIIAEAKFLRSWSFFNLVQLFGAVPMPLKPAITAEEAQLPRTPIAEVYQQIILDLQEAEMDLPSDKRGATQIGRPIQATAKFLLAKVYLTMAGFPLQDANAMALAKTKIQEVIDLEDTPQGYKLLESYADAIWVENNDERIFAIQQTQSATRQGTAFGHVWGSRNRILTSPGLGQRHGGFTMDFYNSFDATDTRRDVTMAYSYVDRDGITRTYGDGFYPEREGIYQNKYVDLDQNAVDGDPDMIVYRYSDALLMAAEIENSLNGPTAIAYGYLNRVRSRAQATDAPDGMTQEEFAEYVYEERYKELSFEFQEIYDIRRLGKVEEVLSQHPENVTWSPTNTAYSPNFNLWPIPVSEINNNPEILENNPGW
ncbi:RagB/SusD family nutrient uptake outer membrane protein [Hyunsoonleella sp. SJ7]|uniref:RagB/SusD family nutrient uptake outer membrane protein n=1 Tax=Hyunsoonleella aquatilis TaxID=2762758 RepID=A0A923HA32_9FLAO|nr:RagB/SusD family nutrient uptake outer membrane protein [Hyunsoonleella aquatilis]MBC3757274.1 RagB/SusD family nutrient uptake outer membrane protein [Hyunsoonleella aquatilis]